MNNAVFIDRDGCIIDESPAKPNDPDWVDYQVDSIEKLEFLPGSIKALQTFVNAGFSLVLISNQDGRGTEIFPENKFLEPHNEMIRVLKKSGVEFNREFICPHFPDDMCPCRKPKVRPELKKYLEKEKIILNKSFVIGDRDSDMEFAMNLGCTGIQIGPDNDWPNICKIILNK